MQELVLLFAQIIPEEILLEEIEQALIEFKVTASEDSKNKLAMYCMFFCTKVGTKGKDITEMSKQMSEMSRIKERMNHEKVS